MVTWNKVIADCVCQYFNPHHHAGGDILSTLNGNSFSISIHTTTQVVTWYIYDSSNKHKISIHTTTQVVTSLQGGAVAGCSISIHTTTQVVTGSDNIVEGWVSDFNPHHHAGGDT